MEFVPLDINTFNKDFDLLQWQNILLSKVTYIKNNRFLHFGLRVPNNQIRYNITISDSNNNKMGKSSCAVFLVPQGKENLYIYSSEEGQKSIMNQAGYSRIIFIFLNSGQLFTNLQQVQQELNAYIPLLCTQKNQQVPYITVDEGIGNRDIIFKNDDESFIVEDVNFDDNTKLRRLTFLPHNLIQTEIRLKKMTFGLMIMDI